MQYASLTERIHLHEYRRVHSRERQRYQTVRSKVDLNGP